MVTRILKPDEIWRSNFVQAVCFEFPFNIEENKKKMNKETPNELTNSTYWGVFSDDEAELMGTIVVNNFIANFDNSSVKMGGIGGVATLPQYRHRGVIKNCFNHALLDMYNNDFVISTLYPFSRAYYRQFGFENGPFIREHTISLVALPTKSVGGTIEQLFPGDDFSPLTEIYNNFCKRYNLAICRKNYPELPSIENLLEQKRYIYLWRDENNNPRGFCIAKKTDNQTFNCTYNFGLHNAFFALDAKAYQALFHFIRSSFISDYNFLKLDVPESIHLDSLVQEGNRFETNLLYNGMVRIINCKKALEICHCKNKGSLIIQIEDKIIPQNNGTWHIDFENNKPNQVTKTTESPDITMPISSFSQLICGIKTAEDLTMMPEVIIHNKMAKFDNIFYTKPCYISELF